MIFWMTEGRVSIGRMLEEKNKKINPREMVAMVPVSSDLKSVPMIMPSKIKKVVINAKITAMPPKDTTNCSRKKYHATPKIIPSWMTMTNILVMKLLTKNVMEDVGVMKFYIPKYY